MEQRRSITITVAGRRGGGKTTALKIIRKALIKEGFLVNDLEKREFSLRPDRLSEEVLHAMTPPFEEGAPDEELDARHGKDRMWI
jgi:predicted AAA+ superfamily ATPase